MDGIPFKNIRIGRQLKDLHANELRLKLINAGVPYSDTASKQELIRQIKKYGL